VLAVLRLNSKELHEKFVKAPTQQPTREGQWIGFVGKILTGNHGKITIKYDGFSG